jgi:hypothetical protein
MINIQVIIRIHVNYLTAVKLVKRIPVPKVASVTTAFLKCCWNYPSRLVTSVFSTTQPLHQQIGNLNWKKRIECINTSLIKTNILKLICFDYFNSMKLCEVLL